MSSPPPLVLYDAPGSPCARRVRITLLEKGLPWDTVIVDLSRMQQKKAEYLALNPNGVVPTLVHGDRVVYESNVITEYLDEVFPDLRLYPGDPWQRAQVKLWQAFELSFAKDYRPMMYQRLLGPIVRLTRSLDEALDIARRSTTNPFDLEWERKVWGLAVMTPAEERACADRLYERVGVLEAALATSDFLVGNRFSQAEISVFPRLRMYPYVQLPIAAARFPRVAAWMTELERRPSFEKSLFESERGMQKLANTRVVPWISSRLRKERPTLVDRAGLAVARRFFRRAMRGGDDAEAARRQASKRTVPPFSGSYVPDGVFAVGGPTSEVPGPRSQDVINRDPGPLPRDPAPLLLYDSPLSPSCRRLHILLRAQGLEWESKPVDIARMQQKRPDFVRLNPNGEVPVLRHGERLLYDSALIAEYLDATFGSRQRPSFFPRHALGRAQAKMWIAYDQAMHKEWRPLLYHALIGPQLRRSGAGDEVKRAARDGGLAEGEAEWIEKAIDGRLLSAKEEELVRAELMRKLERLEARLSECGWLVGASLSVADMAWFSRLEMYPALGLPIDGGRWPAIDAWLRRLRDLPAFAD